MKKNSTLGLFFVGIFTTIGMLTALTTSTSSLLAQESSELVAPHMESEKPTELAQLGSEESTLTWLHTEIPEPVVSETSEPLELDLPKSQDPAPRAHLPNIPGLELAPEQPMTSPEEIASSPEVITSRPPEPTPEEHLEAISSSPEVITSNPTELPTEEPTEPIEQESPLTPEWTPREIVSEESPVLEVNPTADDLISPIEELETEVSSSPDDLMSRLVESPIEETAPEEESSGGDLMSRLIAAPLESDESTPRDSLTPVTNSTTLVDIYHSQQLSDLLNQATALEPLTEWAETTRSHVDRLEAAIASSQASPSISGEASMGGAELEGESFGPVSETTFQEVDFWIVKLEQSVADAGAMFPQISDFTTACVLQRIRFALMRRIPIWTRVAESAVLPSEELEYVSTDDDDMLRLALADVEELLAPAEGEKWKAYLLLARLDAFLEKTAPGAAPLSSNSEELLIEMRRELFSEALGRIDNPELKPAQRVFLEQPIFTALREALISAWPCRATPLRILADLERYERTLTPGAARRLAVHVHELQLSQWESDRRFAAEIDQYYRNANMRFCVSEELLNRIMPPRPREYQRFRDRIAGKSVEGHRWTDTQVAFRLLPNPEQLSLALDVEGIVSSATASQSMGAKFENQSRSTYMGAKHLVFDEHGLHFAPAQVAVNDNRLQLRSVSTAFDPIPLLGYIANEVAISEHQRLRPVLDEEMRQKVYREAKEQIDDESDARLQAINERIITRGLDPMHGMGVGPTVISHETTETELKGRWLIASAGQLGGHTPRPSPPPGSLASVQVHETLINNLFDQLDLAGAEYTIAELREHLAGRLNRPEWAETPLDNDDVRIAFAQENPICLSFQEGRIELHLNIARLQREKQSWERFQVMVRYTAEADGLGIALQRDGVVELGGVSGAQIALRGIFGSVFSDEDEPSLTSDVLKEDPRFRGLYLNQCFIDDGWIGLAIGSSSRPFIATRP